LIKADTAAKLLSNMAEKGGIMAALANAAAKALKIPI
jgi:hypothetical protein